MSPVRINLHIYSVKKSCYAWSSYPRPPTRQPNAKLGERRMLLSGPSVGHTPDAAEVKSSRPPTDHSTLGPFLRRRVNLRMRALYPRHVLVMLLSTYWQRPPTIHLEWINTVQQNHAQTHITRWDLGTNSGNVHTHRENLTSSQPRPFMFCITVYLKTHPLLNRSLLLTEKFNDSCRALCISICYWQSFISVLSVFPHPASEGWGLKSRSGPLNRAVVPVFPPITRPACEKCWCKVRWHTAEAWQCSVRTLQHTHTHIQSAQHICLYLSATASCHVHHRIRFHICLLTDSSLYPKWTPVSQVQS